MNADHQTPLVRTTTTDTSAVRAKVEEDIAFLTSRISIMENHPRPNRIVLDTYQTMLSSRVAVLKWLLHGSLESEATNLNSKRSA